MTFCDSAIENTGLLLEYVSIIYTKYSKGLTNDIKLTGTVQIETV